MKNKNQKKLFIAALAIVGTGFFALPFFVRAEGEQCGYSNEGVCRSGMFACVSQAESEVPTPTPCPSGNTCCADSSATVSSPTNLRAAQPSPGTVVLSWDPPANQAGLAKYRIYRDANWQEDIDRGVRTYNDWVHPGTYAYQVYSLDAGGLQSSSGLVLEVTVAAVEAAPVRNLQVTEKPANSGMVEIKWQLPTQLSGVGKFRIERDGVLAAETRGNRITSYVDNTVPIPGNYLYTVVSMDVYGDRTTHKVDQLVTVYGTYVPPPPSADPIGIEDCEGKTPGADCNDFATGDDGACVLTPDGDVLYCEVGTSPGSGGTFPGGNGTFPGGGSTPGGYPGGTIGGIGVPGGLGLSDASARDIATNFLYWLFGIFGLLAVMSFAISGFQYLMSGGDPGAAERGKKHMIWSIIGVAVALSGIIIVRAVDAALKAQIGI